MLNNLKYTEGSRKDRTRRCRGLGSGLGKNGGSGNKGQNSRSGGGTRLGFEGGQLPLFRRIPKRGFNNFSHVAYATVNVGDLNVFPDGSKVDLTILVSKKIIKDEKAGLKVLGGGKLEKKLEVTAKKFSKSAKEAIEKLGGKAVVA
jgi:large subunit ribosomal protein L15